MPTTPVHQVLDQHLETLIRLGSEVELILSDPPTETSVRTALGQAGYNVRDDVVDFFTWRGYTDPDKVAIANDRKFGAPHMFWETAWPVPVEQAIELQQTTKARGEGYAHLRPDLSPEEFDHLFPGPSYLLPILILDGREWVSVDCRPDIDRGAGIYWCFNEWEAPVRIADDIVEAIELATYCLEAGIWTVSDDPWSGPGGLLR